MTYHFQIILYNSSRFLDKLLTSFDHLELPKSTKLVLHFMEQSENKAEEKVTAQKVKAFEKTNTNKIKVTHDCEPNYGFGKGHNQIHKKYASLYDKEFFILNPDCFLFYNFFAELERYKEILKGRNWGILEPLQFPAEHPKEYKAESLETRWAAGACMLINCEAFEKVEKFDENIFMYGEDVDISFRMKQKGYKIFTLPKVKFIHVTQSFDTKKKHSFEFIHSQAANIYMRYKFGNEEDVKDFIKELKKHPWFDDEIIKLYEDMKKNLPDEKRIYIEDFLLPDKDYTSFRWK